MSLLSVNNLNKSFKNTKVLKDLNLYIEKGEIVALIGPNGSGKTTLMKCIAGLLKIDSGSIKIDDISILDNREKYLEKFSSVIETPSLYELLTGYENLKIIKEINNVSDKQLNKILNFIKLGDKVYSKVKTYSLGMKQRLALGIALLTEPKLLILDEPTNGLDPHSSSELCDLLVDLSKNNDISIIISSHILSDLKKISDKLIFIKNGEILSEDKINSTIGFSNVIFGATNINNLITHIKDYNITESIIKIQENKINVNILGSNIPILLNKLSKDNLEYTYIDIINSNLESTYNSIYGGDCNDAVN